MARPVKCPYCNESFDRDTVEHEKHNNRYYHKECFKKHDKDAYEYKRLIEYICRIKNIQQPTGFITKQIKLMKDEKGYTNNSIFMTLYYMVDILGEKFSSDLKIGIGAVEYRHAEAQKYFKDLVVTNKHNKEIDLLSMLENYRQVKIEPREKKTYTERKEIDLGGLFDE